MVSSFTPNAFLRSLPKAELHLHLEGSVEPATLLELRQRHGMTEANLGACETLYQYQNFTAFLMAFKAVTEHLRTADDYELITYRMIQRLHAESILHAEVFISVGICLWRSQDFEALFEGMERGRERGARDFGISVLWIFDAVRQFGSAPAQRVAEIAAQYQHRNVTGFGIGGDEKHGPPELFRDVYAYAAREGLHLTAHAGESAGPESVWGALNLGAERIGHGLNAGQDPELLEELAQRQVPLEVCLTSNVITGCCARMEDHPVRQYFDHGLMLTLNTDDPAMFRTSLCQEYAIAEKQFSFTEEHLRELARNSFEASFLPAERKVELLELFDAKAGKP